MIPARRLVAAAGAGVLALIAVAPPAWADHPPAVELTSPLILEKQDPITGTITADQQEDQTLSRVTYALIPESSPNEPGQCFVDLPDDKKNQIFDNGTTAATFDFELRFPCNRKYILTAKLFYENPGLAALAPRVPGDTEVPMSFSVAIPPRQVRGLKASYDAATREVSLDWESNPEPDLIRYDIERDPSGRDPATGIGRVSADQSSFIDRNVGEEFRYQVTAVRRGAGPGDEIRGDASLPQEAGLSAPEPSVPQAPPAGPDDSGRTGNGGAGNASGASSGASRAPSRSRASSSNIFEETLPFDPSRTTTIPPDDSPAIEPSGDAAALAEFDDEVSDEEQQRATLVPVAGGLALIVGALHLFLLSKRAGESDIPIVPR